MKTFKQYCEARLHEANLEHLKGQFAVLKKIILGQGRSDWKTIDVLPNEEDARALVGQLTADGSRARVMPIQTPEDLDIIKDWINKKYHAQDTTSPSAENPEGEGEGDMEDWAGTLGSSDRMGDYNLARMQKRLYGREPEPVEPKRGEWEREARKPGLDKFHYTPKGTSSLGN